MIATVHSTPTTRPHLTLRHVFLAAILPLIATLLAVPRAPGHPSPAASAEETLVLFVGSDTASADRDFAQHIPSIRALADELGVQVETRTLDRGVPAHVVITPLIIFQNARGRSIYQGRYANLDRLRNFIRTARYITQGAEPLVLENLPASTRGRATIATPVKLTPLGGTVPDGHDDAAFRVRALPALADGMTQFELRDTVTMGRGDRLFYVDVHPYLDDGLLYLSCEIYSQFNCHEPVYSGLGEPLAGFWDDRERLFAEAGRQLSTELWRLVDSSTNGDAFTPIASTVPSVTWSELGLDLPVSAPGAATAVTLTELPRTWNAVADESIVLFRFAPPLDHYRGEARQLTAHFELGADGLTASRARFEVPIAELTMGNDLLDSTLRGATYFAADTHPTSSFSLERIDADAELQFGEQTIGFMHGTFEMKGIRIPLSARTRFEPIVDGTGAPRLLISADWTLRIRETFDLIGPEGPSPERDTVLFLTRITMKPADDTSTERSTQP